MCDHSPNREAAMPVVAPGVWCDPCIADLVATLNTAGFASVASCCGHGRRPSRISLADGRDVLVMSFAEADEIGGLWPGINDEQATAEIVGMAVRS